MRMPLLYGIGLQVRLVEPLEVIPFGVWSQSIGSLGIEVNWARDMSGRETEGVQLRLERVAVEGDGWRIVEVMNAEDRATTTRQLKQFAEWKRSQ
jgi:hypothetical protein